MPQPCKTHVTMLEFLCHRVRLFQGSPACPEGQLPGPHCVRVEWNETCPGAEASIPHGRLGQSGSQTLQASSSSPVKQGCTLGDSLEHALVCSDKFYRNSY